MQEIQTSRFGDACLECNKASARLVIKTGSRCSRGPVPLKATLSRVNQASNRLNQNATSLLLLNAWGIGFSLGRKSCILRLGHNPCVKSPTQRILRGYGITNTPAELQSLLQLLLFTGGLVPRGIMPKDGVPQITKRTERNKHRPSKNRKNPKPQPLSCCQVSLLFLCGRSFYGLYLLPKELRLLGILLLPLLKSVPL